jgi:hypothetical protein
MVIAGTTLVPLRWKRDRVLNTAKSMIKLDGRVVETPMGSTIDSIRDGGYWVCDRDHNGREVRGLWEAEEHRRERERGFDYPYATNIRPVQSSLTPN